MSTKSYKERLRAAIAKSDAHSDVEQAIFILKQAIEAEIALIDKIESMPMFRVWLEGERFDFEAIKARRK